MKVHISDHILAKSCGTFEIILSWGRGCPCLKEGEDLGAEIRATVGSGKGHQWEEENPQGP